MSHISEDQKAWWVSRRTLVAGCLSKQRMNRNNSNKQKFVLMLDESMDERIIQTHLAKGDVDVLIVQIAVYSATKHVIEYTTLLVLLHLHADPNLFGLIFRSERRNMLRVWNKRLLQNALGPQICNLLRFAHAIAGCDINSHLFWHWEGCSSPKVK